MKKAKAVIYDFHRDYDVKLDKDLLNMKIRIYDENFPRTGTVFYQGPVGKFIRERIPSEYIVKLLPELLYTDKLSYRLSETENFIERIR